MDVLTHFSLSYPLGFLCFYSSIFIILSVSLFLSLSPPLSFFSGFLSLSVFLSLSLTSFLQSHNCAFLIFEQLYALFTLSNSEILIMKLLAVRLYFEDVGISCVKKQ